MCGMLFVKIYWFLYRKVFWVLIKVGRIVLGRRV